MLSLFRGEIVDSYDIRLFFLKGIHPTTISDSFQRAAAKASEILTSMSTPVELSDKESLLNSARTSLSSKASSFNFQVTVL